MGKFYQGQKVFVLPGLATYVGGAREHIEGTHDGVVIGGPEANDWYEVDVPALPIPINERWMVHADYLRPRDDPEAQGDWGTIERLTGWNPSKSTVH